MIPSQEAPPPVGRAEGVPSHHPKLQPVAGAAHGTHKQPGPGLEVKPNMLLPPVDSLQPQVQQGRQNNTDSERDGKHKGDTKPEQDELDSDFESDFESDEGE